MHLMHHKKVHFVEAPIIDLSSTFIRKSILNKKNIKPLVSNEVWQFLDEMNFYK